MTLVNLKLEELECVSISLPPALLSRAAHLGIALVTNHDAQKTLSKSKVLRVKKKLFACEHFALIQALQRIHPGLEVEFIAIDCESMSEAERIIHSQLKLASILSPDAIEVPAFESAHGRSLRLMNVKAWAKLFEVNRTTFYHHNRKFQLPVLNCATEASRVDLSKVLSDVPNVGKKGA